MGLFDTVQCDYPLPDRRHQDLQFQTKDLGRLMEQYRITPEGHLIKQAGSGLETQETAHLESGVPLPIHGDLRIYDRDPEAEEGLIEYLVRFTHGRVEWVRRPRDGDSAAEATAPAEAPAIPPRPPAQPEPGRGALARAKEVALLESLQLHRTRLSDLFVRCSSHWGFEDPVYRFYHQSFKVFALQAETEAVVQELSRLLPGQPMNSWFLAIVERGTGKQFEPDHNQNWTAVTRPILEAFFHARYFLEMALRYAHLEAPPNPVPSGYAALLYLYGLR